jgi:hypothetical protein
MPQTDDRARLAAANNADIYELVFRALGLPYRRDSSMFVSNATPPSYYGNMTTLDPDDAPRQLAEIRNLETASAAWTSMGRAFRSSSKPPGFGRPPTASPRRPRRSGSVFERPRRWRRGKPPGA